MKYIDVYHGQLVRVFEVEQHINRPAAPTHRDRLAPYYGGERGQLPEIGDDRRPKKNPLNANFEKQEFKALWSRINRKAASGIV